MGKLRRVFRGRGRGLLLWILIIALLAAVESMRFCRGAGARYCQAFEANSYLIVIIAPLLVASTLLFRLLKQRKAPRTFKTHPLDYHDQVVTLTGRVAYILPDTIFERAKRKATDIYRTAIDDDDPTNRFIHQRFLISSPDLKWGQKVLIEHNVKFGKVAISKGKRVEVKGIYLHTVDRRRRNLYGRIHFTHAPHGHIELL